LRAIDPENTFGEVTGSEGDGKLHSIHAAQPTIGHRYGDGRAFGNGSLGTK